MTSAVQDLNGARVEHGLGKGAGIPAGVFFIVKVKLILVKVANSFFLSLTPLQSRGEPIPIPKELRFRFLGLFLPYVWNLNRNRSRKESEKNQKGIVFRFTIPHFTDGKRNPNS